MRVTNKSRGVSGAAYSSMFKQVQNIKKKYDTASKKLSNKPMGFSSAAKSKQLKSSINRAVSKSITPSVMKPKPRPAPLIRPKKRP